MTSALVGLLLAWALDARLPWTAQGTQGGPKIVALHGAGAPRDRSTAGGWRFEFSPGTCAESGYVLAPLDGDRIAAHGLEAIELEGSVRGGSVDVVLVAAAEAYRARAALRAGGAARLTIPLASFVGDRGGAPPHDVRPRALRFEAPVEGLARPVRLDLRAVRVRLVREAPEAVSTDAAVRSAAGAKAEGSAAPAAPAALPDAGALDGFFPFGVFVLGGNRALFEDFALAGANASVEYGAAAWPIAVLEDHLDAAHASGVRIAPAMTSEKGGRFEDATPRLAPLLGHPGLLAAYTLDEPDGAGGRGMPAPAAQRLVEDLGRLRDRVHESSRGRARTPRAASGDAGAGAARERGGAPEPGVAPERGGAGPSAPLPVLVTCMDSFGLDHFAAAADLLSIDWYLPAYAPAQSFAAIHSAASSVVEIAAREGKVPLQVLQLYDPQWSAPEQQQTPASLRAQAFGALAAGVRGLLFFQGVAPLRLAAASVDAAASAGAPPSAQAPPGARGAAPPTGPRELWPAWLDLAGEFAAIAPIAAGWRAIPGEPRLAPALGEVRAAAFEEGGERWIVLVNLGRAAADVRLAGRSLDGASALEDVRDGRRLPVAKGEWSGRLDALEARLLRVAGAGDEPRPARPVRLTAPQPVGAIAVDHAIVGAALVPALPDPVRITVDGADLGRVARVHRGAAAVLRAPVRDLAAGAHRVTISWEELGSPRESTWTFVVEESAAARRLPIHEPFSSAALDPRRWAPIDTTSWNVYGGETKRARGSAAIDRGRLHLRSTTGAYGVILRGVNAPERFTLEWTAHLPHAGAVVLLRNELASTIPLPAGTSRVSLRESPEVQVVRVDGAEVARTHALLDHRGGAIGIGIDAGGEAWFDDVLVEESGAGEAR